MGRTKLYVWIAFFIVLLAVEVAIIQAQSGNGNGNGNGNEGSGNGNGNEGEGNGNGNHGSDNGNGNHGNGNGNGNGNSGNGNGNNGNSNGNGKNKGDDEKDNGKDGKDKGNNGNGEGNGNGNGGEGNGNGKGGKGNGNGSNGNGNGGNDNGDKGNGNGSNGNSNGGKGNGYDNGGKGNGNGNGGNGNGNDNSGSGNGNGNGGSGNGNGNSSSGNGNGNTGNGNGNGNNGNNNGNDYEDLAPSASGQERAQCKTSGCYKTLTCPAQCPYKKPSNNNDKGCFMDCSTKCEATCRSRKPNCNGYGSLCYDPRFVGADGVVFYFHGSKGANFAIVSDDTFHINAHFIGTRPQGRTRDFTWVQALSVMFDTHTLVVAADRVSHWDDKVDALLVKWDGKPVRISTGGGAEWRTNGEEREVVVERTDETNSVRVQIAGLVEIHVKVRPIGKEENRVHNYRLPADDAFAHLETQFRFSKLSDLVEGVLGKTYRSDYVSPVKLGVAMPTMGGEDKYQTPSLLSPLCRACRFQRPSGNIALQGVAQY